MLTDSARRRCVARLAVLALLACCVLAGTIPAAVELSRQGLDSWTSIEPFLDHRDADRPGVTGPDQLSAILS
ncbi:hypothetical protein JOF56_008793 [Kibdelosporangium banguiense]|uniref:Uncharacterized protein n=1 Tax=Kibdelosporangium banguiense TaxID=1365924 RepID=A0ABS4TVM2_9PSEU|nr:hypothetical protein [Kibdelosporangium banguiense]MBP2328408.1 hypothetical protein [Kibdelosporangium banguiense]